MLYQLSKRMLATTDKRLLWKLCFNFGYKGMRSVQKFKARLKKGEYFPPFLYISVINSCNLRCQGCWVKVDISALLGGDIYAALRQRSAHAQSRFARERDDQRALEERKKCLAKLQAALDIPAEVMNALPTADDIRAKAARAGAGAATADDPLTRAGEPA